MSQNNDNPIGIPLPASLAAERRGDVAVLQLKRAHKRNALDDDTVLGLDAFFSAIPDDIGAVLLTADGDNFSAGLDLSEFERTRRARGHRAFKPLASRLRKDPVR